MIMCNCANLKKRMRNQDTRGWTAVRGWHIRTATLQFISKSKEITLLNHYESCLCSYIELYAHYSG